MDVETQYRDAWADSKQSGPETMAWLAQISGPILAQIRRESMKISEMAGEISVVKSFRDFYSAVDKAAEVSRIIANAAHNLKVLCEFQVPPVTLFSDHFVNQFFLMAAFRRTWWVEGPAFCGLAIQPGSRILELGCGTGYYTDVFFSPFASEIIAIDIDPRAIETARRFHQAKNIRYEMLDCRESLPGGPFEVVIWTPSIFAYTSEEVDGLMTKLREVMVPNARLCGFTAVETEQSGEGILWHDLSSLGARLRKYFGNVRAFERTHVTIVPPRHQLYFYASDGPLPFDADWHWTVSG